MPRLYEAEHIDLAIAADVENGVNFVFNRTHIQTSERASRRPMRAGSVSLLRTSHAGGAGGQSRGRSAQIVESYGERGLRLRDDAALCNGCSVGQDD